MTSIRLLKNGIEAFPAMFAAMNQAASSLALEMYIFADDQTGREFRQHLIQAAKRGISVQVLVDSWGCWYLPDTFWDEFRSAGGSVRCFHPLLKGFLPFRNHRKLLLVDGRIAYIGGFNIADAYYQGAAGELPWRDNGLEIEGPEVSRLRRSFLRMWSIADAPLRRLIPRLSLMRRSSETMQGTVRFLESGPEHAMFPVRGAYHQMIQHAAKHIDLAMGYFYPHGLMLRSLKRAVRRGVRVRLMLPRQTDVAIARWAAWGLYGRLLRAGIEVWEYTPSMLHSKLAISDDAVIVGSANLDIRSGRFN
jgi:cardiolipin synthase